MNAGAQRSCWEIRSAFTGLVDFVVILTSSGWVAQQ